MLKIKDDVDLKELEKYGYELQEDWYNRPVEFGGDSGIKGEYIYWKHVAPYTSIEISVKDREIYQRWEDLLVSVKEEYIDDLIKADLVEKVSDE